MSSTPRPELALLEDLISFSRGGTSRAALVDPGRTVRMTP